MTRTAVLLEDDQWARVVDALESADGSDGSSEDAVRDCRDAIATQVDDDRGSVDTDTAFELLADPVRRELLWTCSERGDVGVDDLVDSVASELDSDPEQLGLDFHHRHIPKLTAAGVVTVESDTVQYDGNELLDCLVAIASE